MAANSAASPANFSEFVTLLRSMSEKFSIFTGKGRGCQHFFGLQFTDFRGLGGIRSKITVPGGMRCSPLLGQPSGTSDKSSNTTLACVALVGCAAFFFFNVRARRERVRRRSTPRNGSHSSLRTPVNNIEYFPPNFEGLVLGCIDADFCK